MFYRLYIAHDSNTLLLFFSTGSLFSSKYWKYYDDYANNYGAIKR